MDEATEVLVVILIISLKSSVVPPNKLYYKPCHNMEL